MKHAMLGVGGVGGLVGAAMARAGEDVTLIMRPESMADYDGVMRVSSAVLGDFQVEVPAVPRLSDAVDVLWVTPKATDLDAALGAAPTDVVGDGRVVTLMNGIDHLRLLEQRYRRVIGGAMRVESERVSPGLIRQASPFIQIELSDGEDLVDVLKRAGVDAKLGRDSLSILWEKLAFLAPLALATTAYDANLGEVRGRREFHACQAEAVAVGQAEGAARLDLQAVHTLTAGAPEGMRSSMQKDREQGLPLELDAVAGPITRGGLAHQIPTPMTEHLRRLIEAKD